MLQHATPHGGGGLAPPAELLGRMGLYAGFGVAYALTGWVKERSRSDGPEPFSLRKAGQTALVGALAGVIVAWKGEEFDSQTFEVAMGAAAPAANELLNAGKNERRRAKQQQ